MIQNVIRIIHSKPYLWQWVTCLKLLHKWVGFTGCLLKDRKEESYPLRDTQEISFSETIVRGVVRLWHSIWRIVQGNFILYKHFWSALRTGLTGNPFKREGRISKEQSSKDPCQTYKYINDARKLSGSKVLKLYMQQASPGFLVRDSNPLGVPAQFLETE